MEIAIGLVITLLVALLGTLLHHISRCSEFHERVAKLEGLHNEVHRLRKHAHDNREAVLKLEAKLMRDER